MTLPYEVRPCCGDEMNTGFCGKLTRCMFKHYLISIRRVCSKLCDSDEVYTSLNNEINIVESLTINTRITQHDKYIQFTVKALMSIKASLTSSSCMHYCQGELRKAACVLHVEFDLDDSVQPVCGCRELDSDNLSKAFCVLHCTELQPLATDKKLAF